MGGSSVEFRYDLKIVYGAIFLDIVRFFHVHRRGDLERKVIASGMLARGVVNIRQSLVVSFTEISWFPSIFRFFVFLAGVPCFG